MSSHATDARPALPVSIWVVAYSSLADQVLQLARRGVQDSNEISLLTSVLLGALLVGYVSAGVVRARTVRLVLAWIVLGLSLVGGLLGLADSDAPGGLVLDLVSLATTVVALVALWRFHQSDWFAWQRTKPPASDGPPIGALVAIGVMVGVLGGVVGATDDGVQVDLNVAGR